MRTSFVAGLSVAALAFSFMLTFGQQTARGKITADPLTLMSVPVPTGTLSHTTPSNQLYTVSSTSGPFCIEEFFVAPGSATIPNLVLMGIDRIDGTGASHTQFQLEDGSGGSSPQDLVLSYGNHICAQGSVQFHATQFGASGADVSLFGSMIVLTQPGNVVTAALGGI
jgi:hypothetical protein